MDNKNWTEKEINARINSCGGFGSMDDAEINELLDHGMDVNHRDGNAYNALSCEKISIDTVKRLIDEGIDVDPNWIDEETGGFLIDDDETLFTPMHIHADNLEIIKLLVEAGAGIDCVDSDDANVLFAENISDDVCKYLIEKGINVNNVCNRDGRTPLFEFLDNLEITKLLVEAGADVNAVDDDGYNVLSECDNADVYKYLIENGINIDYTEELCCHLNNMELTKLLVEAGADVNVGLLKCNKNCTEAFRYFIEKGANINAVEDDGSNLLFTPGFEADIYKYLIEKGVDVNCRNSKGETPLFKNVGNIEVFKLLADAGADINAADNDGNNVLFDESISKKVCEYLIEKGIDVNHRNNEGKTPIFSLVNNLEVVKLLADAGADVNVSDNDGNNALFASCFEANVIKYLVEKGADVTCRNKKGKTPLHIQAGFSYADSLEIVKRLVEAGADVNAVDDDGNNALCEFKLKEETFNYLIKKGIDVNHRNKKGKTPLLWRIDKYNECPVFFFVKLLVKAGADVNAADNDGNNALNLTYDCGDRYWEILDYCKIYEYLIEKGIDVNHRNNEGKTPLLSHVKDFQGEIAELLAEAGADVNAADNDGNNALFDESISKKVCKYLIKEGIDVNHRNNEGKTPLFKHVKNFEVVKMLVDAGADPNVSDNEGNRIDWDASDKDSYCEICDYFKEKGIEIE